MAIADTITSMQTHTSNAYTMIGYGTDLTGINKNLANLYGTIFEAFLEALRTPDTLFTNLPKKTGSGSNIALNDTAYAPMRIVLNTTETTQASTPTPDSPSEVQTITGRQEIKTCGKNLFNKDTTNFNKGNYLDQNCNITSGTNWGIYYIPVISNTAYTISGCTANTGVYFWWLDSNKNSISLIGSKKDYTNITSPNNAKYIGLSIVWNTTSSAYDGTTFMLEQNSSVTTYEPYKEQVNEINLGKNLYNANDTTYYGSCTYVSGINTDQYKIEATGTDVIINAQVASGSSYSSSAGTLIPCKYGETIYYNTGNSNFSKNFITQYNSSKVSLGFANTGSSSGSYTPTNSACEYISIRIGYGSATNGTEYTLAPIIEKGSTGSSYSPYFTPIELCKIGTYQDKIFKNSGKNLANPSNINMQCALNDSGAMYSGATTRVCVYKVPIKPSTTYSLSCESGYQIGNVFQYDSGGTYTSTVSSSYARTKQYTSSSTTYYISFVLKNDGNTTINVSEKDNLHIQIEKSSSATEYEPYGSGEWYVKKNIGKVVLNGTESTINAISNNRFQIGLIQQAGDGYSTIILMSNMFVSMAQTAIVSTTQNNVIAVNGAYTYIRKTDISTVADFRTWLGTNKPIVYYVLATPTYEKLNDELQQTIESASYGMLSYKGQTNIIDDTENLPFTLDVTAIEDLS